MKLNHPSLYRAGCFSAATASMKLTTKRSHAGNQFLMDLLDVLEDVSKQSFCIPGTGVLIETECSSPLDEEATPQFRLWN